MEDREDQAHTLGQAITWVSSASGILWTATDDLARATAAVHIDRALSLIAEVRSELPNPPPEGDPTATDF